MEGSENKLKKFFQKFNLIKKINTINYFLFLLFILILINLTMSIFLFKKNTKNTEDINNIIDDIKTAQKNIEINIRNLGGKTDAIYNQVNHLRVMNQNLYYNRNNTQEGNK